MRREFVYRFVYYILTNYILSWSLIFVLQ